MFVVSAVANSPRGQVLQEDESQSALLLTSASWHDFVTSWVMLATGDGFCSSSLGLPFFLCLSVVIWLEISGLGSRRCLRKYVPLAVVRLAP